MEMVITELSVDEVVRLSRQALGLPASDSDAIDEVLIACALRRAAGFLCPCSPSTLVEAVLESFQHLFQAGDNIAERVTDAAEALVTMGDLLELRQATVDDPLVKATWVFAAPPSFVQRPSGSIFLIGIVPDEAASLPTSLSARVTYEGYTRALTPEPSEDLPSILRDLGLLELPQATWLKAPKKGSAADLHKDMIQRLLAQEPYGTASDISILDPARKVDYYKGRWVNPSKESGSFVARRPQAYGAPLWGFADLDGGRVTKFLDFPLRGNRWRGCDVAWQLQMAIDWCRGTPQLYRRKPKEDGACLEFFSPIPLWAERRLAIWGRPSPRERCLFSYWIPERELASEEAFLRDRLWLALQNESK
jgi:hypothetical protein